jgi:hypothetical protein
MTVTCYIRCIHCGGVLDTMEIVDGGRWDYAEKFGYVAAKAHERDCPGLVTPSTLGSDADG